MSVRLSWDQYFMTITRQVAERSTCTRAKVGAVIVRDKNILATGYPMSQPIACDSSLPSDDIEQTVSAAASSLTYDANADQYVYVWKTDKAWANSCRILNVTLKDGTSHLAFFRLSR